MRVLVATVFLVVALGGCSAGEGAKPGAAYLQQVRKDLPSLDDVSDTDLVAYGRYACKNPNAATAVTFGGHGPTKGNEMEGMYKIAMRHCGALNQ